MSASVFNHVDFEEWFPAKSRAYVQAVIERAMRRELASSKRHESGRGPWRSHGELRQHITRQLAGALNRRGSGPSTVSVRRLSPNGCRSFHFDHSSISCSRSLSRTGRSTCGGETASGASKESGRGRASEHMRYVEREGAIEAGAAAPARTQESERMLDDDGSSGSGAAAGQRYVENVAKVGDQKFSFGTIGSTLADRAEFWTTLEEHERNSDCRVQERLILELPHEASGEARLEMVREFCAEFVRCGLPYWAALHAPGPHNDARNFHAHVVYSTRPARMMADPADGKLKWDFAITEVYRTKSRNRKIKHPYRQRRCAEMTRRGAVSRLRARFAEVVNAVCERHDVRDVAGRPVRYDPRTYRAMGLGAPVIPLKRSAAERARDGMIAVPDGGHTRASLDAVAGVAESQCDRALSEAADLDAACERGAAVIAERRRRAAASRTETDQNDGELWAAMPGVVARRLGQARSAGPVDEAEEELERASLARTVEATSPAALARPEPGSRKVARPPAPEMDRAVLQVLHEEAKEEERELDERAAAAKRRRQGAVDLMSVLWVGTVAGPDVPPEPRSRGRVATATETVQGDAPSPLGDRSVGVTGMPAMPAGSLERVRARLPAVLATMNRVMGALRAMALDERMQALASLTGAKAAQAFRALVESDDVLSQTRETSGGGAVPESAEAAFDGIGRVGVVDDGPSRGGDGGEGTSHARLATVPTHSPTAERSGDGRADGVDIAVERPTVQAEPTIPEVTDWPVEPSRAAISGGSGRLLHSGAGAQNGGGVAQRAADLDSAVDGATAIEAEGGRSPIGTAPAAATHASSDGGQTGGGQTGLDENGVHGEGAAKAAAKAARRRKAILARRAKGGGLGR